MKKTFPIFLVMVMFFSLASTGHASGTYQLVGRELSPGIQYGDTFYGALFLGKIFDGDRNAVGYFSVLLDRKDVGVEDCGGVTPISSFKLIMNFSHRKDGRLVLVKADEESAEAYWYYNDNTGDNGSIYSYSDFLDWLANPGDDYGCNSNEGSLIASVGPFALEKRWGSWGDVADSIYGNTDIQIEGWLVHIPWIPMVFGSVGWD